MIWLEQKDILEKFKNAIVDLDLEKALDSTKEALNNAVSLSGNQDTSGTLWKGLTGEMA